MWGPGPCWWFFPVIGLLMFFLFVVVVVRTIAGGGRFMYTGLHNHDSEEIIRLRREIEALREQVKKQAAEQ